MKISDNRYGAALVRLRTRIADGLPLEAWDDVSPGCKDTHCSWGMCTNDPEQWPSAGDHIWPVDFMDRGRIAPRYKEVHQKCPMDTRAGKPGERLTCGCFYRCRVFQRNEKTPSREEALALFDAQIAKMTNLTEVCGCDDTGVLIDPLGGDKELPCPDCRPDDYKKWRASFDLHEWWKGAFK